ncbi:MAG: AIDA repeat-containing protein [Lentisphaeria bacterium]|nr:AIDA repeat-containing protein [Lentisphaeria bacterium]
MKGETPTTILIQDGKVKDLNMRGTIYLENGGTADNITFSRGNAMISSGCTATNLKFIGMESGGGVYIDKYGYLNGAIFESGTGLTMSYYASAANVSALGGDIRMVDTCRIDNALIANGGVMSMLAYEGDAPVAVGTVLSHGLVTSTYHDSYNDVDSTWTEDLGGKLVVWKAVVSDTTIWEKGTATIYGQASNTTIHSGGSMVISGGVASGVTVSSGGSLRIEDYGTATAVNVLSGGRVFMYINPNTHVSGTYEGNTFAVDGTLTSTIGPGFSYNVTSGGAVTVPALTIGEDESLFVYSGATFQGDLTVNRGGNVYIDYGVNATGTVLENGGWVNISNENVTFLSNTIDKLQLTSGLSATVHSKTVANSTLIQGVVVPDDYDKWRWSQLDVEGGVVYDTEIRENGQLYVNRNGSAFRTRVYTGGDLYLYESSFASDAVATGSDALIDVGYSCTAVGATLNDHASMSVWDKGLASSTTVSGGAIMGVYGGSAIDTVILGGTMEARGYYYSSGVCNASNTTVSSGGSMIVYSYGLAVDTTVNAGGSMAVYSSGSAINVTIASGAGMEVYSSGEAYDTIVEANGGMTLHDYGFAYDTTVESGGSMAVYASGYASNTTVKTGGVLHVSSGGEVESTTINGAMHVLSSGWAFDTTVAANGALHVSSGGWAYNTTVEADGVLHVESGGILFGTISVADGGEIAAEGGIIAFDLTYSSPGTNILVDNMAAITGNPDYRIGLWPGYSSDGFYTFASGAESFIGTMTLTDGDDVTLGTLSVGEAIEAGGKYFMLTNDDGNLSLLVSAYPLVRDDGPDDHWNNYIYDKKNKENPENPELGNFVVNTLAEGVTEVFVDRKYSVTVDGMHNFAGKVQGFEPYEDDLADYAKIELATGAKLTFDIDSHIAGKFVIYSYDAEKKKLKSLQSTSVKLNKDGSPKTTSTKEKFLDAGTYYVSMQVSVSKKKYAPDGFYNVKVGSNTVYFKDDDSGWNNWLYDKKKDPAFNSNLYTRWIDYTGQRIQADNSSYYVGDTYYQNFVGFGDDTDFVKIHLYSAVNLSLNLYGTGAAADVKNSGALKVVLYSFDSKKNKMTALQTTTIKAADLIAGKANTKLKLLESGDYYISVTSTNAKKGDKVYYTTSVGSSTVFFNNGDGWNDYVYDAKNTEHPVNTDVTENDGFTVKTDYKGEIVNFDYDGYWFNGQEYTGFVGHNDEKDFVKINIAKAGTASFNVVATDAAKIEIWSFDTDKLKMKSLQSTALKKTEVVDGLQMYGIDTKAYAFKEPGEYYLSITSTNAKTGGNAYYNVTLLDTDIVDSEGDASPLSMPEPDSLGISDALSFAQYDMDALADASAFALADLDGKSGWQSLLA